MRNKSTEHNAECFLYLMPFHRHKSKQDRYSHFVADKIEAQKCCLTFPKSCGEERQSQGSAHACLLPEGTLCASDGRRAIALGTFLWFD